MNQLYRENMEKKRTSLYNKKRGGRFSERPKAHGYKGTLVAPEPSFQEKTEFKRRIAERNRKQRIRLTIAMAIGTALVILITAWFANFMSRSHTIENRKIDEFAKYQAEQSERYLSYGDHYLNLGQWYNAAFEYRTSLKYTPKSDEALYRLTFALIRLCETEGRGCNEAFYRLNALEKRGFDSKRTQELGWRWEGLHQTSENPTLDDF